MYRIRSASGLETTYASLEEFTDAVRRGGVSADDQIYHTRADRWLAVRSHPHYRNAIEGAPEPESLTTRQADVTPGHTQIVAKPMLKPEPAAPVGDSFLIMSDGLESPIRNAGGHRSTLATAEPRAEPKPRESVRIIPRVVLQKPLAPAPASPGPAAPPQLRLEEPPPAKREVTSHTPAAPSPLVPPLLKLEEPLPAKREVTSHTPVAPSPLEPPAQQREEKFSAPGPVGSVATSATAPPVTTVATLPPADSPVEVVPQTVGMGPREQQAPAAETSGAGQTPGYAGTRHFVIGGVIVAVLAAVALVVWHPWTTASPEPVEAQTVPQPTAQAHDSVRQEFAASVVAAAAAQGPGPPPPAAAVEPQVLAPVRPALDMNDVVPSADVELDVSAAPKVTLSPSELARRVTAAEAQARAELDRRLGDFSNLFTPARLIAPDGVRDLRTHWGDAGDAIRAYRAAIARLESVYGDSLLQSQRATRWPADELRAWSARASYAEPAETSQISDLMVDQVTEALDLLVASKGSYQIHSGRIKFNAAADAARYSIIQGWIANRQQQWVSMPASTRPATIALLLGALGGGLPTP